MKLSYSKEDLVIGFFILLGVSYPFITALIIFLQYVEERRGGTEEVRSFYSFLLGLEECKRERAEDLLGLMSEGLLREMGGVDGLVKTCQSYRKAYPEAMVEERLLQDGLLMVVLTKKEKGITRRLVSVKLHFKREDKSIRIERLEYEKGS